MHDWPASIVTEPSLGQVSVSPDGKRVAYTHVRADLLTNRTVTTLYVKDTPPALDPSADGPTPDAGTAWFETPGGLSGLAWSPTGDRLAFVAAGRLHVATAPGQAQCWLVPDPQEGGLGRPYWAPTREELIVIRRGRSPGGGSEEPLVVRDLPYKQEGSGLLAHPAVLLRISPDRVVTYRAQSRLGPTFALPSPDGKWLAMAEPLPEHDELGRLAVRIVPSDDPNQTGTLLQMPSLVQALAWSPDSTRVAALAAQGSYGGACPSQLWVAAPGAPGELWDGGQGRYLQAVGGSDGGLAWMDNRTVLAVEAHEGTLRLLALQKNAPAQVLTEASDSVSEFSWDTVHRRVWALWHDAAHLPEVSVLSLGEGPTARPKTVTRWHSSSYSVPEIFWIEGAKGDRVQGWLLTPTDADADAAAGTHGTRRKAGGPPPCVFLIHGGPYMAHTRSVDLLAQALAASGIAVAYLNPHGSIGYGERFATDIVGDWGGVDRTDWEAFRQRLLAEGRIDGDRLAVMGASYGGFMAAWLAEHWEHLKAAVIQAPVIDQIGMLFGSDVGFPFTAHDMAITGPDLSDAEVLSLWHHSPLAYASQITAPVLLLCGDRDQRCPVNQTEALFVALRRLGRKAQMVIYPGETHLLTGSGRPLTRVDRATRILAFLRETLLYEAAAEAPGNKDAPGA